MMMYTMMFITPMILTSILIIINYFFSKQMKKDREKPSPFECGFNMLMYSHMPFSNQFFMISIVFLIFDMELLILTPLIPSLLTTNNLVIWYKTFLTIMIILFFGLMYEWNEQTIMWIK